MSEAAPLKAEDDSQLAAGWYGSRRAAALVVGFYSLFALGTRASGTPGH